MTVNPLDPLGVLKTWTDNARRAQDATDRIIAQAEQGKRTARLAALVADVDTAYAAWRQHPDAASAGNLADAITHYRENLTDA